MVRFEMRRGQQLQHDWSEWRTRIAEVEHKLHVAVVNAEEIFPLRQARWWKGG